MFGVKGPAGVIFSDAVHRYVRQIGKSFADGLKISLLRVAEDGNGDFQPGLQPEPPGVSQRVFRGGADGSALDLQRLTDVFGADVPLVKDGRPHRNLVDLLRRREIRRACRRGRRTAEGAEHRDRFLSVHILFPPFCLSNDGAAGFVPPAEKIFVFFLRQRVLFSNPCLFCGFPVQ